MGDEICPRIPSSSVAGCMHDTRLPAEPSPMTSSSQSPLAMSVQFLPLTEHCPQSFPSVLSVPLFGSYDFWETLSLLSGYSLLYNNYLQI